MNWFLCMYDVAKEPSKSTPSGLVRAASTPMFRGIPLIRSQVSMSCKNTHKINSQQEQPELRLQWASWRVWISRERMVEELPWEIFPTTTKFSLHRRDFLYLCTSRFYSLPPPSSQGWKRSSWPKTWGCKVWKMKKICIVKAHAAVIKSVEVEKK